MENKTKGSGLIFAVVLLFVILGMVVTLSSITVLETKMSQKTKSSTGAFFNADSGVEWALNKIANSSGDAAISTIGSCPFTGCSVLFLDKDGKVLATSATIDQVKAVRSVGTQGADTQRAIEAAVAESDSYSYIYYCFNNNGDRWGGTPLCVDSGGSIQGYCPTAGETQKRALGEWGTCLCSGANLIFAFLPPGGECGTVGDCPSGGNAQKVVSGKAFVCNAP